MPISPRGIGGVPIQPGLGGRQDDSAAASTYGEVGRSIYVSEAKNSLSGGPRIGGDGDNVGDEFGDGPSLGAAVGRAADRPLRELVAPGGLLALPTGPGLLVVDQLLWGKAGVNQSRSGLYAALLIGNLLAQNAVMSQN